MSEVCPADIGPGAVLAGGPRPLPGGAGYAAVGVAQRGRQRNAHLRLLRRQAHHPGLIDVDDGGGHGQRERAALLPCDGGLDGHSVVRAVARDLVIGSRTESEPAVHDREVTAVRTRQGPGDRADPVAFGVGHGVRGNEPRAIVRDGWGGVSRQRRQLVHAGHRHRDALERDALSVGGLHGHRIAAGSLVVQCRADLQLSRPADDVKGDDACAHQLVRQRVAVTVGRRHRGADVGPNRCVLGHGQAHCRRGEGGQGIRRGPEFRVVRTSAEVPGVTGGDVPVSVDAGIAGWRLERRRGLSGHAGRSLSRSPPIEPSASASSEPTPIDRLDRSVSQ